MQRIILIVCFIVIVGVLGTGEKKFPVSVQDDLLVEKNHARSLREAKNKNKRKAGKKTRRKTLKRKEKKQKLKTRRKTKGGKQNKKSRKEMKKGQKIKKKIQTMRKGNRKGGKKSKKQFSKENRQESCTGDDALCILNAIEAMEFEKKQIKNFIKQKKRIEVQSNLAENKYNKNGGFAKPAEMMLSALGNDSSAPVCGDGGNSSSKESLIEATRNYLTLSGCGESIKTACTVDEAILNDTATAFLDSCLETFDDIKKKITKCQDEDTLQAACTCWNGTTTDIDTAKKTCIAEPVRIAKLVKKEKDRCLTMFIRCKKAEDAAVGLIHTCIKGEVRTLTADGRLE